MLNVILEENILRDGLQSIPQLPPFEEKVKLLDLLVQAGVQRLQIGSFVRPDKVPQMRDTDLLARTAANLEKRCDKMVCSALVLNGKGLSRALTSGLHHLTISCSLSEQHSRCNAGLSAQDALAKTTELIRSAIRSRCTVRAGIQAAFGTNEESMPAAEVVHAAHVFVQAGATEINLADTYGVAQPSQVYRLSKKICQTFAKTRIFLHAHGGDDRGLANVQAALAAGVRAFDTVLGGLGGCPFAASSTHNVSTQAMVDCIHSQGMHTGIDLAALSLAQEKLVTLLQRHPLSVSTMRTAA